MERPKLKIRGRRRRNGRKHDVVLMKRGAPEKCWCESGAPQENCCGTVLVSSSTRKGAEALLAGYRSGERALPV